MVAAVIGGGGGIITAEALTDIFNTEEITGGLYKVHPSMLLQAVSWFSACVLTSTCLNSG